MKYFTRRRYQAIQGESSKAEREWKAAGAAYAKQLRTIRERLPASSKELCDLTFHDGTIESLDKLPRNTVRLVVDASNNPWGPRGRFELKFLEVASCVARGSVVGDFWVYEEIHLAKAGFALHVLFERSSLVIAASGFAYRPVG